MQTGKRLSNIRISVMIAMIIFFTSIHTNAGIVFADSGYTETTGRVDAISYIMDLDLNTATDVLSENVTIKFRNRTNKTLSEVYIRNMASGALKYYDQNVADDGKNLRKSCRIKSIRQKGSKGNLKFTLSQDDTLIKVKLAKKLRPGCTGKLVVRMSTGIPNRQDRFGVQKTKYGKLYTLSFCFPYLADNSKGVWNKDPYFDDGESRSNDIANYYVKFKAPKSYVVAATGREKTGSGITRITASGYRDFAIVASNFMKKDTFKVKGIRVNNYYLKGNHPNQYRKLSKMVAEDSITLFSNRIGKYLYDELDLTQCLFGFGFGGMEYPGLVMINGSTYCTGEGHKYGAQSLAEVVAHEIGHQWFYAAVGNREYSEGWIDEGFTTYLEKAVYAQTSTESGKYLRKVDSYVQPIATIRKEEKEYLKMYKDTYKGMYLNISPSKYPADRTYADVEYDGGYLFLVDVREKMGTKRFNSFLKEYYRKYTNKVAKTKDVVRLIRKYDNSKAMNRIIRFYIKL